MKKLISLLICVAMIMAFATAAFASADSELAPRPDTTVDQDRPDPSVEADRPDPSVDADRPDPSVDADRPDPSVDADRPDPGADDADRPDPGADDADRPDPGADDVDRPDPGADDVDRPDPGAGEEPPVVEMFTLTIAGKTISVPADTVAIDKEGANAAEHTFIIYTPAYKGTCVTNGYGEAFVVSKEGKVVRIFDGMSAKYYDETITAGATNSGCTASGYATEAFASRKEGETVIIAPHGAVANAVVYEEGKTAGTRYFMYGCRTIGATVTGLPEVKDENAGSITVVLTDTYLTPGELHSFTAPVAGKYTFVVPAEIGVFSKTAWDNHGRPELDFYENTKGSSFVVDLKANEVYEFYASGTAKGTYEFTWTVIPAVVEEETVTSGSIPVKTTDTYCFAEADFYTFTAQTAGKYTFTLPAGLGLQSKESWNDMWGQPEVDFYDNAEGGKTVEVTLKAGETYEFYVGAITKGDWTITWTVEATGDVVTPNSDTLVIGENTVTFTENDLGDDNALEFTFVVEVEGKYKFSNSKLLIRIYDEDGNMIPIYNSYLTPGTYTIKMRADEAGSYVVKVTTDAVINKTPELVIGTNNVVFNGEEAIEHTFVVTEAGDYEFKGDALVVIFNADGVRLGAGMVSLEPGTYKANVVDMMGIGGTIKITVVFTPAASAGQTDEEAAAEVDKLIEAIGTVTHDSKEAIEAARNAYEALSDEAKALVKNLKVLEDAEAAFKALPPAAGDGSQKNPIVMEVGKTYDFIFTEEEVGKLGDGLYYTFTATEDGTLVITVPGWDASLSLLITGMTNKNDGTYTQDVVAGQVLSINPWSMKSNPIDVDLVVSFVKPEAKPGATEDTALDVEEDKSDLTLSFTGAEGTYFAWTATADGTVTFALDSSEWLQGTAITVNGKTLFAYGTRNASFDVKAGDVIYIICKDNSGGDDTIDLDVTFEAAAVEPEQPEQPEDPIDPPVDPEQPDEPVNPDEPIKPMGDATIYVFAMMAMAATALVVLVSKKRAF